MLYILKQEILAAEKWTFSLCQVIFVDNTEDVVANSSIAYSVYIYIHILRNRSSIIVIFSRFKLIVRSDVYILRYVYHITLFFYLTSCRFILLLLHLLHLFTKKVSASCLWFWHTFSHLGLWRSFEYLNQVFILTLHLVHS